MSTPDSNLQMRPRFRTHTELPQKELIGRIASALTRRKENWTGEIVDNHIIVKIPRHQQHYWSPQLTMELEEENGGTLIRGLYGPKPGVWTMFVFFYSSIGFLTLMALIFGLSQMMLKMDAYGLWLVLPGCMLMIGLFIISKIGQRLGRDQMQQLHGLLDESLKMESVS